MRRIGITQRVADLRDRGERRDCLDQAWTPLLQSLGFVPIPIPNCVDDVERFVAELQLAGIILSGGNDLTDLPTATDTAPERDTCEHALVDLSAAQSLPLLGVCRGLHLLAAHYGTELEPVTGHVAIPHAITLCERSTLTLSERDAVNSFHNYGLRTEGLSKALRPVAAAPDGTVEAFVHERYPQAAIMWHPERAPNDPRDAQLIQAFFKGAEP